MILKIKIEVESKGEAYNIVSELGLDHKIIEADLDGQKEKFDKENKPREFLKNKDTVKMTVGEKITRLDQIQKDLKAEKYESRQ